MITKPIKTNIITGFLGVGKTTLIKQLLANKPEHEKWAVLVNEFGEIGIDGGLLHTQATPGITIKEVPGGCLCCAAGVPTQVAITQLIQQAKPDRLLIEPTGLGHPAEIIKLLQAVHFQHVIKVQTSLCLVDARKVRDERYYNHDIFIQQIQVADIVMANKAQHYAEQDQQALTGFMAQLNRVDTPVIYNDSQRIQPEQLQYIYTQLDKSTTQCNTQVSPPLKPKSMLNPSAEQWFLPSAPSTYSNDELQQQLALQGYAFKTNQGEGCVSYGWIIDSLRCFSFESFMQWLESVKGLNVLRLKAIVITHDGILIVNMVDGHVNLDEHDDALDSRIEIISDSELDVNSLQQQLLECIEVI
ncbi:GTP-binding protein [Shewanella sp.]|uniref:CobW family GTP-binding protein n=1 Tax=Shewanella sp. TaxID=50422 RepID=UPI003567169B